MKLNEKTLDKLHDEYDTSQLLRAVDAIDACRGILAGGFNLEPPEIREQLMKVHQYMSTLINEDWEISDEESDDLLELTELIMSDVLEMQEQLDTIYEAIRPLEDLYPDPDEEWDDDEE